MTLAATKQLRNLKPQLITILESRRQLGLRYETRLAEVAYEHAARVGAIVLYGDPKIDEPLAVAWGRAADHIERNIMEQYNNPIASVVNPPFHRELFIRNGKLLVSLIKSFATAPDWLLAFTNTNLDADILGFGLPDLRGVPQPGEDALNDMLRWPQLPVGTLTSGTSVTGFFENFWDGLYKPIRFDTLEEFEIWKGIMVKPEDMRTRNDRLFLQKLRRRFNTRIEN